MKKRRGFTLIEVLITLGLMVVVLSLVGVAVDTHLRQLSVTRMQVEEAQLARAIVDKIARDIRSVVVTASTQSLQVDTSALSSLFGLPISSEMTEMAASLMGSTDSTGTSTASEPLADEGGIAGRTPGIYGDIDWIQIDTARLPRGEMYGSRQVRSGASFLLDRLSPSKTVLYYLGADTGTITDVNDPRYRPDQLAGNLGSVSLRDGIKYGLFRREQDRDVTRYAIEEGTDVENMQYDEPLAPEVESIEFSYFDPEAGMEGTIGDWVDVWDMDERQMLPRAIRIVVAIRRQRTQTSTLTQWTGSGLAPSQTILYSLVVPVPIKMDPPAEEEQE